MNASRAPRDSDDRDQPSVSHLRVATRSAPTRPRWRLLYTLVALVLIAGTGIHAITTGMLARFGDGTCAVLTFAVIAVWIQANRLALSRLEEPDAVPAAPPVRVLRSRRPPETSSETFAADRTETGARILPFDVR